MSQNSSSSAKHGITKQNEYVLRSIDFTELLFFVQTSQVAIGLFNLPRVVAEQARHDGWMAVLISGAVTQIAVIVIILLLRRFESLDLYAILRRLFGKWIGLALGLLFALYCLAAATLVCRSYTEALQTWLFPTSNTNVFIVLLMLPTFYCATGGARVLARFGLLTFFVTIWMMLLLIVPISKIQTDFYFPILEAPITSILHASYLVTTSSLGFELLLVYYPFIQNKKKALLASSLGIWITTFIYWVICVVAIGFYSQEQLVNILSPSLHLFKIVELPMIERIEHIGIATWSFLVVSTAANYLWSAGRYLYVNTKWSEPACILALAPVLFVASIFPQNAFVLVNVEKMLSLTGSIMSYCFPLLLLLCALLLRKKGTDRPPQEQQQPPQPTEETSAS